MLKTLTPIFTLALVFLAVAVHAGCDGLMSEADDASAIELRSESSTVLAVWEDNSFAYLEGVTNTPSEESEEELPRLQFPDQPTPEGYPVAPSLAAAERFSVDAEVPWTSAPAPAASTKCTCDGGDDEEGYPTTYTVWCNYECSKCCKDGGQIKDITHSFLFGL